MLRDSGPTYGRPTPEQRLFEVARRMTPGTVGGLVRSAAPVQRALSAVRVHTHTEPGFPLFSADFVRAFWAGITDTTVTWINGFFSLVDGSQIRSDVQETYIALWAWIKGLSQPSLNFTADLSGTLFNLSFLDGTVNNTVSTQVGDVYAGIVVDAGIPGMGTRFLGMDQDGLWFEEFSTAFPTAGTNQVRLYAKDNGSGKTQLVAQFNTGAAVVIATEP